ncbi:MAG: DUF4468 domain-containing protein [Prevotellaceae bacterium]|nr:DUF4468 domain-containing protein [Prevotellaceae bacterium]
MKKFMISLSLLFAMGVTGAFAQNTLTPEEQVKQAQKQLQEAQAALAKAQEEAKKAAEQAKIAQEQAQKAAKAAQEKAAQQQLKEIQEQTRAIQEQTKAAQQQAAEARRQAEEAQQQAQEADRQSQVIAPQAQPQAVDTQKEVHQGWTAPTTSTTTPQRKSTQQKQADYDPKSDPKYLAGAVTTDADGKIVFRRHINMPGKSKAELYQAIQDELTQLTTGEQEITGSRISLLNPTEGTVVASVKEWLTFQATFLSLDRSEVDYNLIVNCHDGSVDAEIRNIVFRYEQDRSTGFVSSAEDVISDKLALNKKGTKLSRGYGKFRKGMIDRKNQIFDEIQNLFK